MTCVYCGQAQDLASTDRKPCPHCRGEFKVGETLTPSETRISITSDARIREVAQAILDYRWACDTSNQHFIDLTHGLAIAVLDLKHESG